MVAHDILVNFEISLAVFIPNTPRNRAISYTNCTPLRPITITYQLSVIINNYYHEKALPYNN